MKRFLYSLSLFLAVTAGTTLAHHGGASISQGPGTPIETNTPLTLPQGKAVVFSRFENAAFRKFESAEPYNTDSFRFYQLGASYGITDALSATLILPYNAKSQNAHGTFRGFGDVKFLLNAGLNWDSTDGLRFNGADDVAEDIGESGKLYLGAFGGMTFPTGRDDIDLGLGVDGGLQPGFGSPTFTAGLSAAKALTSNFSLTADTSLEIFTAKDGGDKFGNEFRANLAGVVNLVTNEDSTLRQLDGIVEVNYLRLSRDETAGVSELGTGGQILYVGPGMRAQLGDFNLGALVKFPVASGLNERSLQQGSEGLEKYRLVLTASKVF